MNFANNCRPEGCNAATVGAKLSEAATDYRSSNGVGALFDIAIACGERSVRFMTGGMLDEVNRDVATMLDAICQNCPNREIEPPDRTV